MASGKMLALRAAQDRPTFEAAVETIHPAFGWVLVKEIDMGTTSAGLVLPDISAVVAGPDGKPRVVEGRSSKHHEVIESSKGCCRVGLFCETDVKRGDRVVLCSGATRASMSHFPRGVYLVMLEQVIAYERPAQN